MLLVGWSQALVVVQCVRPQSACSEVDHHQHSPTLMVGWTARFEVHSQDISSCQWARQVSLPSLSATTCGQATTPLAAQDPEVAIQVDVVPLLSLFTQQSTNAFSAPEVLEMLMCSLE